MEHTSDSSTRKFLEISNFSVINHNVLAFGKNDAIGFVNIEKSQLSFHHVVDKQIMGARICGISCMAGNRNEPIYAIGDISTPSRIILFSSENVCIGQLKSMYIQTSSIKINLKSNHAKWIGAHSSGFYGQLEFWESDLLIALTYCENYFLEIWNWRNRTQLLLQKTDFLDNHQCIQ